jgi:hypothetical protein
MSGSKARSEWTLAGPLTATIIDISNSSRRRRTQHHRLSAAVCCRLGYRCNLGRRSPGLVTIVTTSHYPVSGRGCQFFMTTQHTTWGTWFFGILHSLVGGTLT